MKEKLYTIPVNDAFAAECECPICSMKAVLEQNAVEYTMGPSYMEDDVRMETDRMGFCERHMKQIYDQNNRLGLALVAKTHMDKIIKDIESMDGKREKPHGIFKKTVVQDPKSEYLRGLESTCFVCGRIENSFERYIVTVFYLWKNDEAFRTTYKNSKGFCNEHYRILIEEAPKQLSGSHLEEFLSVTDKLYLDNMKRVRDDVDWFINKFDYRYQNEPWKNSKDALPRALTKLNGIIEKEQTQKEG